MNESDFLSKRLSSHRLTENNLKTPKEVVEWLGAVQAQDYNMAKWAIGARLPHIADRQIEDALNNGDFVRIHILRPTWHFVSSDDIYWMLALSSPRVKIVLRSSDKVLGLTPELITKVNTAIARELEPGIHLTRQEVGQRLKGRGIDVEETRVLNHIMYHAELDGVVCNGEVRNKKQTYCLLEEKVSRKETLAKDEALERLTRKYFQSHSPATLQDFVWWSGLSTGEAKLGMELIKNDFYQEEINSKIYWFGKQEKSFFKEQDQSMHLLPAFDEYFVSYKDRQHLLAMEHYKKVIVSSGVFRPMIVKDGAIIGTWKRVVKKSGIVSVPEFFEKQNEETIKFIEKEGDRYKLFNASL